MHSLLILDEATSALDIDSENEFATALDSLRSHMTVLLITHRTGLLRHCDIVFELADGKLAGSSKPGHGMVARIGDVVRIGR
jgi:ABC-type bacteriocin/lantibiotic exporter with double-glycine peptidase domain